jgi:hypothetical protein
VQSNGSESKSHSQSPFSTPSRGGAGDRAASLSGTEQEQHIAYLKQAFCGFVKAKEAVEMEHLGELYCHRCAVIRLLLCASPVVLFFSPCHSIPLLSCFVRENRNRPTLNCAVLY